MQATIYLTPEALAVATAIKDQGYYERMEAQDNPDTDLSGQEGYFLKNINHLRVAALPAGAHVALRLVPEDPVLYQRHVSFPTNLRGCVFEGGRQLEEGYAENVTYWSGTPTNSNTSGSAYFQNPDQEYMIDLSPLKAASSEQEMVAASLAIDKLLSEGVVVRIIDLPTLIADLSLHDFIEVKVPVVDAIVGIEGDDFRSSRAYPAGPAQRYERIFLKVADIWRSPDPDRLYLDLIRPDQIDYGFWY